MLCKDIPFQIPFSIPLLKMQEPWVFFYLVTLLQVVEELPALFMHFEEDLSMCGHGGACTSVLASLPILVSTALCIFP